MQNPTLDEMRNALVDNFIAAVKLRRDCHDRAAWTEWDRTSAIIEAYRAANFAHVEVSQ